MDNTKMIYSKLLSSISKLKKITDEYDIEKIIAEHNINTHVTSK